MLYRFCLKRVKLALKDFVEVERWDRMEMSNTDILAHICERSSSSNSSSSNYREVKWFVCFVLFCFVIALSQSRKRDWKLR